MKKSFLLAVCIMAAACSQKNVNFTFVQMSDPQIGFGDEDSTCVSSIGWFSKAIEEKNPATTSSR